MTQHHRFLGLVTLLGMLGLGACAEGTMDDQQAAAICGDNSCSGGETASSCPQDCTGTEAICGDDACNGTENINTCPADCSGGGAVCGDHTCNGSETSNTCPGDCGGATASCGDTVCNGGETSTTCPVDCPSTGGSCGDFVCDAGEATSCPSDCSGGGAGCGDLVCDVAAGECTSADINCLLDCTFDDQCGGGGGGGGTCDHDICTAGTPLDASCGTCESAMCDYDSYCCTTEWDSFCIDQVATVCTPTTCP